MTSLFNYLLLLCLIPCLAWSQPTTQWVRLQEGLDYTALTPNAANSTAHLQAFRIDPHLYTLQLTAAKQVKQTSLFVDQIPIEEKNALIAINGGFFSPELQSLGLRISRSQTLNPLKKISWWGIFLLQNNRALILPTNAYHFSPQISFAIQAGPRLLIDGQALRFHEGRAQRSALGITRQGKIIIAVTDNLLLSMQEMATLMGQPENTGGLGCYSALNLDGGSSSQLYAHVKNFNLHVRSLRPVADIVVVTAR